MVKKNEAPIVPPTLFVLITATTMLCNSVLSSSSPHLSPPIFCCTYCWFICEGADWISLYPFLNWSCLLYNVSLCGWLWRNHGMLYNDANFWFYIKRRDSQNKVRALTLYRAESLMLIAHSHFFILYSSSSFLPIRFSTYAISYATIGCWRNNDLD